MEIRKAVCVASDLWEVQTTIMHNTLVSAKTAKQAKEKTQDFLQDGKGKLIWQQRTRIKDNVNVIANQ